MKTFSICETDNNPMWRGEFETIEEAKQAGVSLYGGTYPLFYIATRESVDLADLLPDLRVQVGEAIEAMAGFDNTTAMEVESLLAKQVDMEIADKAMRATAREAFALLPKAWRVVKVERVRA